MQTDKACLLFGGHSICTSKKGGTLGYFAKCRHNGQYGVLTCAHVVDDYHQVESEESGHQGIVMRKILDGPRNVDGAFINFDRNNMSFQFVDHSVLKFPIQEIENIKIHSKYKYYGNISWREGNSPVTGTIELTRLQKNIKGYAFSRLIRLSKPVEGGDSGALVLSEDGHAIGIAIARFEDKNGVGQYGFAIPIQDILNNLEVDLAQVFYC